MDWSWWVLLAIPAAWFIQNCVHETSHLIVGYIHEGRKPLGMYPYPHKHNNKWYFARCRMGPATIKRSGPYLPRYIAPFYAGLIVSSISFLIMSFLPQLHKIFALPSAICGLVDAFWFWRGYIWGPDRTDGRKWKKR